MTPLQVETNSLFYIKSIIWGSGGIYNLNRDINFIGHNINNLKEEHTMLGESKGRTLIIDWSISVAVSVNNCYYPNIQSINNSSNMLIDVFLVNLH